MEHYCYFQACLGKEEDICACNCSGLHKICMYDLGHFLDWISNSKSRCEHFIPTKGLMKLFENQSSSQSSAFTI